MATIKPLRDRVVVKPLEAEEQTQGGIYIPTKTNEKVVEAEVISVGEGKMVDGSLQKMVVSKGQKVVFNQFSGTEIELEGVKYMVLSESDILAVIE